MCEFGLWYYVYICGLQGLQTLLHDTVRAQEGEEEGAAGTGPGHLPGHAGAALAGRGGEPQVLGVPASRMDASTQATQG